MRSPPGMAGGALAGKGCPHAPIATGHVAVGMRRRFGLSARACSHLQEEPASQLTGIVRT